MTVRHGDGYRGWEEKSPFDAILITAATPKIPRPLIDQLKVGGRVVLPLGKTGSVQDLMVLTKQDDGKLKKSSIAGVVFVPMTGEIRQLQSGVRRKRKYVSQQLLEDFIPLSVMR